MAYDREAFKLRGDNARLNFPDRFLGKGRAGGSGRTSATAAAAACSSSSPSPPQTPDEAPNVQRHQAEGSLPADKQTTAHHQPPPVATSAGQQGSGSAGDTAAVPSSYAAGMFHHAPAAAAAGGDWGPADEAWFRTWGPGSSLWDYDMDGARGLFLNNEADMEHPNNAQETGTGMACDHVPVTPASSSPPPHSLAPPDSPTTFIS
ncbi:hypothetical protein PR202_ga19604 [Eleusine coracana subsp. coracana]|uniref:AP2/ERF domain-containing protein n=1 Tax=Eleusine coracana subsp. coracana TaxID=191504 RepID=A0AAV5CW12_ELECO|nr:hypothetical protein PR202_ga19604 [Eleusine coracana subsp. coracana]